MNTNKTGLFTLAFVLVCSVLCISQDDSDLLSKFNENLRINFLAPLQAQGVTITNELRAKCIGYQLNRQAQYIGNYEQDRLKIKELNIMVREFIESVSGGQNLWSIVEAGISGDHMEEIERLLGGPVYVTPIVESLDDLYDKRKTLNFSQTKYQSFIEKDKIKEITQEFLEATREKRFSDATMYIAGQLADEWQKVLKQMKDNPEYRQRMETYAENFDWKLMSAGLSDTDPPMVRLIYSMKEGDEWEDAELIVILDAGAWRIIRFD